MEIPRVGVPDALAARLTMAEQHDYLSRRSLFKGAAATGALLAAGPLLLPGTAYADGAKVAPAGRHLAFGRNPRTDIRVAWQVPTRVKNPFLRVAEFEPRFPGENPSAQHHDRRGYQWGHRIPAETRALHSEVPGVIAPYDQYYLHAEASCLTPGRTYTYAVGHDGYDPANGDGGAAALSTFTTAPARGFPAGKFTFTAFGDQGVSTTALAQDGSVAKQNPRFHLLAGDIAYADPSGAGLPPGPVADGGHDLYDPKVWDAYYNQIEGVAASVPWMVTTGNHDMEALYSPDGYGGQTKRWDFPGSGPADCPSVYSFIYGNVGVISLDANDVSYEIPANRGYSHGSQTAWLKRRLRYLRLQPDVDFIVVFFHHCAYSTTNQHASEGGVREEWVPLFDQFHVDLVVNGHNHIYERTDALRGGRVQKKVAIGDTVDPDRDGTVYATCGGGGRSVYSFPVPDTFDGEFASYHWVKGGGKETETVGWSRVRYTGYSFLAIDVEPAWFGRKTTLTVRTLRNDGVEIDRFTLRRTAGLHTASGGFGGRAQVGADPGDA
ncbi:metallophosphoesterase family protein [Amycolatopsis sp., V23-08]|uniref:Metallophosphoesterase family protein n=1 Tax=Amycolatopsis heterodermiae TaxID=3110235 RepID=A0ABU5RKW0_9PSEU|nr:metallophosphoesterase family protein [Amycolatopsis sp., V23-08]MEA5366160.1 metallophosphoesterase family protein [Amycolatopsis sp., V23-08]